MFLSGGSPDVTLELLAESDGTVLFDRIAVNCPVKIGNGLHKKPLSVPVRLVSCFHVIGGEQRDQGQ